MNDSILRVMNTRAPTAAVVIRRAVGEIFLSEGIQKFINPADVGAGLPPDIAMLEEQVGRHQKWLSHERFLHLLGVLLESRRSPAARTLPSPIQGTLVPDHFRTPEGEDLRKLRTGSRAARRCRR